MPAQHDFDIANQAGAAYRADVNLALVALASNNWGTVEPSTMYAHMWWADTTNSILKRRNAANSAWISVMSLTTGLIIGTDVEAYSASRTQTCWIPAGAMTSRSTSGAAAGLAETTTNKVMVKTLDFDASTDEFAQFAIRMPKGWDESTVTAKFLWSAASGTGNVVWGLQGIALSDDDALDTAMGTAQTVTDSVTAAGDIMQSSATSAITVGGSPSAEDLVVFQVYRDADAGGDTLSVDARLHGVVLLYNINTLTDA